MKKTTSIFSLFFITTFFSIGIYSCKKHDEPTPSPAKNNSDSTQTTVGTTHLPGDTLTTSDSTHTGTTHLPGDTTGTTGNTGTGTSPTGGLSHTNDTLVYFADTIQ